MKQLLLVLAICMSGVAAAENVVLDLTNPTSPVEYDESGLWTSVFDASAAVGSQVFTFSHDAPYPEYSNGFFASRVSLVQASATLDDQWGCMAKGGCAGEGTPYLGAYWDSFSESYGGKTCQVNIASPHYAVGCYVCNNPYVYYTMKNGNAFSRPFGQGDWFKLIAFGVDESGNETGSVEYYLADYRSENSSDWFLNDSWDWFDLKALGKVASIYFVMESSDTDPNWGMNTPSYFCLDKFTVSTEFSGIESAEAGQTKVFYSHSEDRIKVQSAAPLAVAVYTIGGMPVMSAQVCEGESSLDFTSSPSGVYIVRWDGGCAKIVK